jgi:hypothetical protein
MPAVVQGMDEPFMYGSHYSCPGYVMFWMVRAAPGHLLRLQGGRFDAPDRLFCSIKEAWDSVTSSTADVKELIPEFFLSDPRSCPMPSLVLIIKCAESVLGKLCPLRCGLRCWLRLVQLPVECGPSAAGHTAERQARERC